MISFVGILIVNKSIPKMEVCILEKLSRFIEGLQGVFSLKRTKITLYIALVLWLSLATQFLINRVYFSNFQIAEAFGKTNTEDLECSLEIVAQHNNDFLSETDKKDIIHYIADMIGLKIDEDIAINRENDRTEYVYHKQAKKAVTMLKIVSLEQANDFGVQMKHYIVARLKIKEL